MKSLVLVLIDKRRLGGDDRPAVPRGGGGTGRSGSSAGASALRTEDAPPQGQTVLPVRSNSVASVSVTSMAGQCYQ